MEQNPLLQTIIARNIPLEVLRSVEGKIMKQTHRIIPLYEDNFYVGLKFRCIGSNFLLGRLYMQTLQQIGQSHSSNSCIILLNQDIIK
jgi:hypothetical protein